LKDSGFHANLPSVFNVIIGLYSYMCWVPVTVQRIQTTALPSTSQVVDRGALSIRVVRF